MNRALNGKSLVLFLALAGAATLSVTVAHAGFQWVPPTGAEAPAAATDNSVPPAEPVTVPDVDQTVLPLPGEEQISAQPRLQPADAAPLNAPRPAPGQTLQLPQGYAEPLPPPAPPQNQNVLKVKQITPPPSAPAPDPVAVAPALTGEPVPLSVSPPPAPPEIIAQPPVRQAPAPAPAVTQTKVIMPQDAPQTAVDSTPNSEKLVINPYPEGNVPAQDAPSAAPAPIAAPAAPSNLAVVEGFGSDMPLALAVQQIVPADYAYAFEGSVNPGQPVSWDGGKAWDIVINDMLAPLNLEAVIEGKVVHIQPQGLQHQSALSPQKNPARRVNINDPGEQSQLQEADSLAGIESAAGDAQAPAAPAGEPVPPTAHEKSIIINPPPAESAEGAAPEAPAGQWDAKAGESLKDILTRWSDKAGVELIWMAAYDYKIKNDIVVQDNFANAVTSIVNSGVDGDVPPEVEIMQNAGAPQPSSVLIRDRRA